MAPGSVVRDLAGDGPANSRWFPRSERCRGAGHVRPPGARGCCLRACAGQLVDNSWRGSSMRVAGGSFLNSPAAV
eukprot:1589215-Pyramimonas_sp.AAC.1